MNAQQNIYNSDESSNNTDLNLELLRTQYILLKGFLKSQEYFTYEEVGFSDKAIGLIDSINEFIVKTRDANRTSSFWKLIKRMNEMINTNLDELGEGFTDKKITLYFSNSPEGQLIGVDETGVLSKRKAANDELYDKFGDNKFKAAHKKVINTAYKDIPLERYTFLDGVNDTISQIIEEKPSLKQIRGVNMGELKRIEEKLTSKNEDIIMMQKLRRDISVLGAANDAKFEMEEVRKTKLNIKDNEGKVKDGFLSGIWSKTKSWFGKI